jgi:LysM repeat protein
MKIIKILGIAAGLHALALILIFANPGCSYTKAAAADSPPITAAPSGDASAQGAIAPAPEPIAVRYSPTRPGTAVASALTSEPVSDVVPATTYTVVRGDNLSAIAKKNQLKRVDLAAANKLSADAVLHIGQKLIIPAKAAPAAPPASLGAAQKPAESAPAEKTSAEAVRHEVKPGETLGEIARRYGVKVGDVAEANNITDPRRIQPGQELVIPAKSARQAKGAKAPSGSPDVARSAAAPASAPAADQDLDAGLKPAAPTDVPVVKIDDSNPGPQPKNP